MLCTPHTHTHTQVYYISGGYLKPANKRYSGGIKNDYTLTFNDDTEVEVGDLPNSRYNRVNSFIGKYVLVWPKVSLALCWEHPLL